MNEEELLKFRKHTGSAEKLELKDTEGNTDVFEFKPLGTECLPDLLSIASSQELNAEEKQRIAEAKADLKANKISMKEFEEIKAEIDGESISRSMTGASGEKLVNLLQIMVKQSYPGLAEHEDVMNQFIFNNLMDLVEVLFNLNKSLVSKDEKIQKQVEELKKRVNQNR